VSVRSTNQSGFSLFFFLKQALAAARGAPRVACTICKGGRVDCAERLDGRQEAMPASSNFPPPCSRPAGSCPPTTANRTLTTAPSRHCGRGLSAPPRRCRRRRRRRRRRPQRAGGSGARPYPRGYSPRRARAATVAVECQSRGPTLRQRRRRLHAPPGRARQGRPRPPPPPLPPPPPSGCCPSGLPTGVAEVGSGGTGLPDGFGRRRGRWRWRRRRRRHRRQPQRPPSRPRVGSVPTSGATGAHARAFSSRF